MTYAALAQQTVRRTDPVRCARGSMRDPRANVFPAHRAGALNFQGTLFLLI